MAKKQSSTSTGNVAEQEAAAQVVDSSSPPTTAMTTTKPKTVAKYTSENADMPENWEQDMADIEAATQENIGVGEIQISRISIAQPTTKEVARKVAGTSWDGGVLFDNMAREIVSIEGKAPWLMKEGVAPDKLLPRHYLPFVPIIRLPSEYVLWPNKDERQQGLTMFHWKELDPMNPKVREGLWPPKGTWVAPVKGQAPPVTEHLNILGIGLNDDGSKRTGLMIASFSKTSFKTGQKLVSSCVQQKMNRLPFWGRVKWLFTDQRDEGTQTWFVLRFANGPRLVEFGSEENRESGLMTELFRECFAEAKALSDPTPSEMNPRITTGKYLQELYINAAQFDTDSELGSGDTMDAEAGEGGSASSDSPNF